MPRYTLVKQNLRSVIYRMCIENRFHLLQSMLCSFFIMKIIVWSISVVSHWPRGPRRGSAAVRLLGLQVRTPPKAWMSVTCESCMWSGSGLCVGMIDHWSREVLLSVACLNAIVKPRQWGRPDPIGGVASWKRRSLWFCRYQLGILEIRKPEFHVNFKLLCILHLSLC